MCSPLLTARWAEAIRRVIDQVLAGLEAAHNHPVEPMIHRDIKPENIMLQEVVGDRWFVKLIDFGLAKDVSASRETSLVLGTVHYMAPEQIEAKNLGPWTDLYAVGVIAYELLVGHRPFSGKDTQQILREKLSRDFDPVARCAHLDMPEASLAFLRRALHRFPEQRFRSCSEFREAWGRVFEAIQGLPEFSTDLTGLLESEDVAALRRREAEVAQQRQALEAERRALEAERKALASERVKVASSQVAVSSPSGAVRSGVDASTPEAVEHWAMGNTVALSVPAEDGGQEARLAAGRPSRVLTGTQSALPIDSEVPSASGRTRRGVFFALGALAVAGGLAVASLSAGSGPGTLVRPDPGAAGPAPAERPVIADAVARSPVSGPAAVPNPAPAPPPTAPAPPPAAPVALAPEAPGLRGPALGSSRRVRIESVPSGASVTIDGETRGVTPLDFETVSGARHRVAVEAPGRRAEQRELVVDDAIGAITFTLAPVPRAAPAPRATQTIQPPARAPGLAPAAPKPERPSLPDF